MCVCLIKVFIVKVRYVGTMELNMYMGVLDLIPFNHKHRVTNFFAQHNLIDVKEIIPAGIKSSEEWCKKDLNKLLEFCKSNNIDPTRVVISESNLDTATNTPFIHVHCPINLMTVDEIKTIPEQLPTTHFNYLAGNYHYDRFMLLQGLYQKDLLKCTHWSAYREINTNIHRQHHFENDFMDFCKSNLPRTMINLDVHNKFPEDVLDPSQYRNDSFILDANNVDAEIFKSSAITIIVDTLANTLPSIYNSDWHTVEEKANLTMFYTKKIIKPILHKRPFITCIGKGKGADKYLQDMGFKTFNNVWNESYFNANTPKERVDSIVELCYNLSKLSVNEIYEDTKDICEHNYNVLTNTDWIEWYLNQIQTTLTIRQATT